MTAAGDSLWDEANAMLRLHGRDAGIKAALKADEAMERVDLDEARKWREVVKRITILLERPYGPLN